MLIEILKIKCGVFPPSSRMAIILEDAIAIANLPFRQIKTCKKSKP